jgi:hypothetical protein
MPNNRKKAAANRYQKILVDIFGARYGPQVREFQFVRPDIEEAAQRLEIKLPKNIGDVVYSQRYRAEWPEEIARTIPDGHDWVILPAGRAQYKFKLIRGSSRVIPRPDAVVIKVPDATPEIITEYAQTQEQAVLAKVRYNRLVDIFLGITTYSLQNHLRTYVADMGQIEIDEIYVGVNREGHQYIIPVQAKGGDDQLSIIQTIQDIACCQKNEKYAKLTNRPISVQFMEDKVIAMFEFKEDNEGIPRVAEERHYKLVPYEEISAQDLEAYRMR